MKIFSSLMFMCLSMLLSSLVSAQDASVSLLEKQYGNITYVSGGIGEEERDEIRLRERDFNLKLLFSERDGSYMGDVDVVLLNAKSQTVLDVHSVGPFLLVKLPGGSYQIKVSANGRMQQGRLTIPMKGKHEGVFRW